MNNDKIYQDRINYSGDLEYLLQKICSDYNVGRYRNHRIINVGYEDLNVCLNSDKGSYLVKALSASRDELDRRRYASIIQEACRPELGIAHPKIYTSEQGILHEVILGNARIYLFVMDYIDGNSFYDLGIKPSQKEIKFLAHQAALINKISLRVSKRYDSWAIVNFETEYERTKKYLPKSDRVFIEPLANKFSKLDLGLLPHCFVHGDIIDTNVLKDVQENLWIIDFSVSNINPRVQELAVLSCNLLYDEKRPEQFIDNYHLLLDEYQNHLPLTTMELDWLPTCINVAHAMHIIGAIKTQIDSIDTPENQYWLHLGREGLRLTSEIWNF
ncbi:MAG TPA: phosphotransferase [Candidatus Hydrogenedentes bacterium]|nr:phosphotransferase [Candidatus Hydrogenedentota bacterium]